MTKKLSFQKKKYSDQMLVMEWHYRREKEAAQIRHARKMVLIGGRD